MDLLDLLGIPKQRTESPTPANNGINNDVVQISAFSFLLSSDTAPQEVTHTVLPLSTDIPGLSDQTKLAIACLNKLNNALHEDRDLIRNELFDIIKGLKSGAPLLPAILPHIQTQILAKNDPEVIANEINWIHPLFGTDAVIAPLILKAVQGDAPDWLIDLIKQFDVAKTAEHLSRICTPPYLRDPIGVTTICRALREMTYKCGSKKTTVVLTKLAWTCLNQMGGVVDSSLPTELTAILRLLPKAGELKPAVEQHILRHLTQIVTTLDAKALRAELKWIERFLDRATIENILCNTVSGEAAPAEFTYVIDSLPANDQSAVLAKRYDDQRQMTKQKEIILQQQQPPKINPTPSPHSPTEESNSQSLQDILAIKTLECVKPCKPDYHPDIEKLSDQKQKPAKQDDITFLQKRVNQRNQRNKKFEESAIRALNRYRQCESFHPSEMLEVLNAWHNSFNRIAPEKESWYGLGEVLLQSIERTRLTSFNSEYDRLRFLAAPVAKAMIAAYSDNTLPDEPILCAAQLLQKYLAVVPSNYPNRSEVTTLALNIVLPRLCASKNSSDWVIAQEILESLGGSNKQQIAFSLTLASHWIGKKTTEPALKILQAQQNNCTTKQHKGQATIHRIACAQLLQEKGQHDQAIDTLKGVSLPTAEGLILMAKVGSLCIRSFCAKSQYVQAAQVFRDLSVIRTHADVQAELKGQLPAILDALLGIGPHETLSLALTLMTAFNLHTSDYWTRWWTSVVKSSDSELINRGWESFHNIELGEQENWDDCLTTVFKEMITPKRAKTLLGNPDSLSTLLGGIKSLDVYTKCLIDLLKVGLTYAKSSMPNPKRQSLYTFLVNQYAAKTPNSLVGQEEFERQMVIALQAQYPQELCLKATYLAGVCLQRLPKTPSQDENKRIQRILDPIFQKSVAIGQIDYKLLEAMDGSGLASEYIIAQAKAMSTHDSLKLPGVYLLSMILKTATGPLNETTHALTLSMLEDLASSGKSSLMQQSLVYLCTAFANPASDRTQWIPTTKALLNRLLVATELRGPLDAKALKALGYCVRYLSKYLNLADLNLIAEMSDCLIHRALNDPALKTFSVDVFEPFCLALGWPPLDEIDRTPQPNPTVVQQCLVLTAKLVEQLSRQHLQIEGLWVDMLYRCLMTLPYECHHTHSKIIQQALYILVIRNSKKTGAPRNVALLTKWDTQMPTAVLTCLKGASQIQTNALRTCWDLLDTPNAIDLLIALSPSLREQKQHRLLLDGFFKVLRDLPTTSAVNQVYCLRRLRTLVLEISTRTSQEPDPTETAMTMTNKLFEHAAALLSTAPHNPDLFNAAADVLYGLSSHLHIKPIQNSWRYLLNELIRSSRTFCHHRSTLASLVDIIYAFEEASYTDVTAIGLVSSLLACISSSLHPLAKIARLAVFQTAYDLEWCSSLDAHTEIAQEVWESSEAELIALPVAHSAAELKDAAQFIQSSLYTAFDTLQFPIRLVKAGTVFSWFQQWSQKTGEILTAYQQTSEIDGPPNDLLQFIRSIHISLTHFINALPVEVRPHCSQLWHLQLCNHQSPPQDHSLKAEILRDSHSVWSQIAQDNWKLKKQPNR